MQAVILAGGLGTRLRPLTENIPKALVPVHGKPFLEYEVELLKSRGVDDLVLCVGYLGEEIERHFGDGGWFGVRISYSRDGKAPLGPIGALKRAEGMLEDEFFVTYGDAYLRLDYRNMMDVLGQRDALGLMAVYWNNGEYGKSDVVVKGTHIVEYNKKESKPGMVWINFGVSALRKAALDGVKKDEYCDEETFYGGLIRERQLRFFEAHDRFYEIGTPGGLDEFSTYVKINEILQGDGTIIGRHFG
ncbi:MAG TPA: sugar phosphate nucleotidyltransferase [Nitrososphaerales archaeon]|nr:sugar phosphate nucleotidyltransferase [Nitrososphaerales archaeon]